MPLSPDRVVITSGTSEGIELALTALAEAGDEVLVPMPTYPLYTAVLAKIGARAVFYRTDPTRGWQPDLDHIRSLITPRDARAGRDRSEQPDRRDLSGETRRGAARDRRHHNIPLLADEVYADLAFDGPVPALAAHNPDAPVITFSSLSKAYLAPGWRAGWMAVGRTDRLDEVLAGIKKLADGRLCSTGPMEYAHRRGAQRRPLAPGGVPRRAARARRAHHERLNAIDGITSVMPSAAFYAMPKVALPPGVTDADYVLALLRATGVLCVYGSGFGDRPGRRLLPRRVPRVAGRAVRDLRPDRRLHGDFLAGQGR